jgi:hypothetical protein
VGKSALVATLTNATPQVADSPFTTWKPTPGMMPMKNIQIQLVDTPSLNRDYVEPELLDLIRGSDLILLVVDLQADPVQQLEDTIALLQEHRIVPRHLKNALSPRPRGRVKDRYIEQRPFDSPSTGVGDASYRTPRLTFVPLLVLVNKNDDEDSDEDFEIFCELLEDDWPLLPVSATTNRYLERLKQVVFERLEIICVYSKPPGKEPDLSAPFVLKKGSTVAEFAGNVHKDFSERLKSARVWGNGVYDGQMVRRDHVLHDGDVVELRI